MSKLNLLLAGAVIMFWTAVVAVAVAVTTHESRGASVAPSAAIATPPPTSRTWPEPQAPFDETPITPIESAGAPMVL
jgi:hypothetical protein